MNPPHSANISILFLYALQRFSIATIIVIGIVNIVSLISIITDITINKAPAGLFWNGRALAPSKRSLRCYNMSSLYQKFNHV